MGQCNPSAENGTIPTYSATTGSVFKYLVNVKWADELQCPARNVDDHYLAFFFFFKKRDHLPQKQHAIIIEG